MPKDGNKSSKRDKSYTPRSSRSRRSPPTPTSARVVEMSKPASGSTTTDDSTNSSSDFPSSYYYNGNHAHPPFEETGGDMFNAHEALVLQAIMMGGNRAEEAEVDAEAVAPVPSRGHDEHNRKSSSRRKTSSGKHRSTTGRTSTRRSHEDNPAAVTALPAGVSERDQQEDAMMRILAGQLSRDWRRSSLEASALERRLRDFQFAQNKRRDKYGQDRPWGILGLYDHLASVRVDLEWAEDAAWRREHNEPYLSWSDFESTRKEGFNKPFFTYILLFVCTILLLVSLGVNGWAIEPLSENPMIGPSRQTLLTLGAKSTKHIVEGNEWYRLFTPMFLHAGFIHYFLNMLALWFIGSAVEQCHGFLAAAIIFTIPAIGGTILSALFLPEYISVGASGGIFGLVGACIADIVMNWSLLFSKRVNAEDTGKTIRHVKVLCWLVVDIVVNCLIGLTPFVDNFTHLGGMVYGFLCGLSTMERLSTGFFGFHKNFCGQVKELFVRFFGVFLCVAFIMVTSVALVESNGSTSPCSSCRYLSCLPMPPWQGDLTKWWYCDDCWAATADAQRDESTQIFEKLNLKCPNKERVIVDIQEDGLTDKVKLGNMLPSYCRQSCDSLFL